MKRVPPIPQEPASLRVGLIGAGKMGLNHLKAISRCSGAQIVGVADPHAQEEILRPVIGPDVLIFDRAEDLLARAKPDVVHIATPPRTHAALAQLALDAGSHIYVEKPFTLAAGDAQQILGLAAERGLKVCAGHQCLFQNASIRARSRLEHIGSVVHVESYFSFHTVRRSISPVDQAKDILPHAVYMLVDVLRAARPQGGHIRISGLDVSADGGIYAVLNLGDCRALLVVTLKGRPVQQYLHVVGTNGSMRVDLVSDSVIELGGPGISSVSALINPYRQVGQTLTRTSGGFYGRIRDRKFGYPGHADLCRRFYDSVRSGGLSPTTNQSIIDTVGLCEEIGRALDAAGSRAEQEAQADLLRKDAALPSPIRDRGIVLVTGANGLLGRAVIRELRTCQWPVRALTREPLRYTARVPGVEYRACDLAMGVASDLLEGVSTVVHCAAETRGGKAEHERNSIGATAELLRSMEAAGVKRLIHVSSVAVMVPPTNSRRMDETTPVDYDDLGRGPYVWGKAQSERLVMEARARGMQVSILRLSPLIDFAAFEPPGRLGREAGQLYVAVGPRGSRIATCDVTTAAVVIRSFAADFSRAPPVVNLLDPDAPTRRELVELLRKKRRDLSVLWLPMWLLKTASVPITLAQRVVLRAKQPLDIASAFAGLQYSTTLAAEVIARARAESGDCGGT